ncbi:hypothetical protein GCM10023310_01060 [Paenibacillus vulneris]|uniref:BppU family phage baseplate upper protein n=1 Tax=Paenibacillus vulneris TaxID=1133364 RepID=A0ABW3UXC3_9BACL
MILTMKRYDTRNAIKAILKTPKGKPVNLTDAQVQFTMVKYVDKSKIVANREATIIDPENGIVCFPFEREETSELGYMLAEFKVTYVDGKEERFPNDGYITIKFVKELGGK